MSSPAFARARDSRLSRKTVPEGRTQYRHSGIGVRNEERGVVLMGPNGD